MAIGVETDFKVYPDQFHGGVVEVLQQNAEAFNGASRNGLRLVPRSLRGHFAYESFFNNTGSLVARRDTEATTDVDDIAVTQDEDITVKLNRRIGPFSGTLDQFKKVGKSPEEISFVFGQRTGVDIAVDYLNTLIRALGAALSGVTTGGPTNAGLNYSALAAATKTMTHSHLAGGLSRMGDRASRIVVWVMHSKPYFDLVQQSIADNVFQIAGMAIMSGTPATLGRPVLVTDSDALVTTGGGSSSGVDAYHTLGLVADAGWVIESEERSVVSDVITGKANLIQRIQGEHAFNLGVKGFKWDVGNGLKNPTDNTLATASNWDKVAADVKSCAGVRITTE